MIHKIDKTSFAVKVAEFCDYIPGVSTATNAVALLGKAIIPHIHPDQKSYTAISNDEPKHYYQYIQEKDVSRSLLLLIPGIGNLIVGIVDFTKHLAERHKSSQEKSAILKSLNEWVKAMNCYSMHLNHPLTDNKSLNEIINEIQGSMNYSKFQNDPRFMEKANKIAERLEGAIRIAKFGTSKENWKTAQNFKLHLGEPPK